MKITKYDPQSSDHTSQTDWDRVRKNIAEDAPIPYDPEDGPYDPNDEAATEAYWNSCEVINKGKVVRGRGERGPQKAPTKDRITIRLSHDVVEHFRATGAGWQARMDEALREWMKRKRKTA